MTAKVMLLHLARHLCTIRAAAARRLAALHHNRPSVHHLSAAGVPLTSKECPVRCKIMERCFCSCRVFPEARMQMAHCARASAWAIARHSKHIRPSLAGGARNVRQGAQQPRADHAARRLLPGRRERWSPHATSLIPNSKTVSGMSASGGAHHRATTL